MRHIRNKIEAFPDDYLNTICINSKKSIQQIQEYLFVVLRVVQVFLD
jgi:hypothetical protein